jgi:RHS repeat-associated protein
VAPSAAVTTYAYDGAGNLTSQDAAGSVTNNTWNVDNRLTKVVLPSTAIATMLYNADGLRVRKEEGVEVVKNVWDFQNVLLEANASDVTQALYTLAPKMYGSLVSQRRGATSHFVLPDALGSIVGLASAAQTQSDTYRYKGYGLPLVATGSTANPFRWVGTLGYYYDASLGRYYVRARHYDPVTARWLSRDPLKYLDGISLYQYSRSNPIVIVDPYGELSIKRILSESERDITESCVL